MGPILMTPLPERDGARTPEGVSSIGLLLSGSRTPGDTKRADCPGVEGKQLRYVGRAAQPVLCEQPARTGKHHRSDWPSIRAPERRIAPLRGTGAETPRKHGEEVLSAALPIP